MGGYGCFCKLGALFVGLIIPRALLSGLHIRSSDFWKLPYEPGCILLAKTMYALILSFPKQRTRLLCHTAVCRLDRNCFLGSND